MESTAEALVQALAIVQQATAAELARNVEEAVRLYSAAVSRLDALSPALPAELADIVRRNVDEIKRKMDMLRRIRWMNEKSDLFPAFAIQFTAMPVPVEDYRVPHAVVHRVFWLAALLERSIRTGAFVTPCLYVSREIWYQKGGTAVLQHIVPKIRYLSGLCNAIAPLSAVTTLADFGKILTALQKFAVTEKELRHVLDCEVGRRKDVQKPAKKSIWSAFTRKAKAWTNMDGAHEECLTWAVNALEQIQVFQRWYIYFTQAMLATTPASAELSSVVNILQTISFQLYHGVCVFLLHDMAVLVERYQNKCRKSAVKLLPCEVKLDGEVG